MASIPLASKGNFIHVYDFRVKPGTGGGRFTPTYAEVVSSTPQAILDRAGA